jgi:hypothetical protein
MPRAKVSGMQKGRLWEKRMVWVSGRGWRRAWVKAWPRVWALVWESGLAWVWEWVLESA